MDRKLSEARQVALKKRIISSPEQLQISTAKNKRFVIINKDGKRVNFGLWPYSGQGSYIDHSNSMLRDAYRSRHSSIVLKDGKQAYLKVGTPAYYAWNILW
jgi:hypothetical protein